MKERRLGKIIIGGIFVHEHTDTLAKVFAKIKSVALQIDHRYDADIFEYTLYSPLFDICKRGEYAPKYELMISKEQDEKGNMISFDVKVKKLPWDYTQPYSPTTMELILENERNQL